jgi:hypothetical protein
LRRWRTFFSPQHHFPRIRCFWLAPAASWLAKRYSHIGTHISLVASPLPFRWRERRIWVFSLSHVAGGDGAQILSGYVIYTSLGGLSWFDGRLQWSRRLALASVQNSPYRVHYAKYFECCTEFSACEYHVPCGCHGEKLFVSSLLPELVVAPGCQVRPDPPRHQLRSGK